MSSEARELECSLCSTIFVDRESLLAHILTCHSDAQSMRCFALKKLDSTSASILFHYYGNKYRCKTCSYKTEHRVLFEEHARCHMHEMPYKCFWCSKDLEGYELITHFTKNHPRVRFVSVLQSSSMEKILKNLGPKAPLLTKPRVHRLIPAKASASSSSCIEVDVHSPSRPSEGPSTQVDVGSCEPITIEDDDDDNVAIDTGNPLTLCTSSVQSLDSSSQGEGSQNAESASSLSANISSSAPQQVEGKGSKSNAAHVEEIIVKVENDVDGYSEHNESSSCETVRYRNIWDFLSSEDSVDDSVIHERRAGASLLVHVTGSRSSIGELGVGVPNGNVESLLTGVQGSTSSENITDRFEHTAVGINESALSTGGNNEEVFVERNATISDRTSIVKNAAQHQPAESSVPIDVSAFTDTIVHYAYSSKTSASVVCDTAQVGEYASMEDNGAGHEDGAMERIPVPVAEMACTATVFDCDINPSQAGNTSSNTRDMTVDIASYKQAMSCKRIDTQPVNSAAVEESPFRIVSVTECPDITLSTAQANNAGMNTLVSTSFPSVAPSLMPRVVSGSSLLGVGDPTLRGDATRQTEDAQGTDSLQPSTDGHEQRTTSLDCTVCQCQLENPLDWARHDVWHSSGMACVQCPVHRCDFVIVSFDSFIQHVLEDHKPFDSYSCPQCSELCDSLEEFIIHLRSARLSVWRCQECRFTCTESPKISEHIRTSHPGMLSMAVEADILKCRTEQHQQGQQSDDLATMQCPYCTFASTEKSHLLLHLTAFHSTDGVRCYGCSLCGFQATTLYLVTNHIARVHPTERVHAIESRESVKVGDSFVCPLCAVRFDHLIFLGKHTKLVHSKVADVQQPLIESFHCDICAYSTGEDEELREHMSTAHANHPQLTSDMHRNHAAKNVVLGSVSVKSSAAPVRKKNVSVAARKINTERPSKERRYLVTCPKCPLTCTNFVLWKHLQMHKKNEERGWWNECPQCHMMLRDHTSRTEHHFKMHPELPYVAPQRVYKRPDSSGQQPSAEAVHETHQAAVSSARAPSTKKSKTVTGRTVNRLATAKLRRSKLLTGYAAKKTSLIKSIERDLQQSCPLCPYKCSSEFNINRHAQVHRVIDEQGWWVQCEYCGLMLDTSKKMNDHMRHRHRGKPAKFVKLNRDANNTSRSESKTYCQSVKVDDEMQNKSDMEGDGAFSESRSYACTKCTYTTSNARSFNSHQKVHVQASRVGFVLKCDSCGVAIHSKFTILEHCRKAHEGLQTTFTRHNLSRPASKASKTGFMKTVKKPSTTSIQSGTSTVEEGGVVRFPCDQCSFVAKLNIALVRHKKAKHGTDSSEHSTASNAAETSAFSLDSVADLSSSDVPEGQSIPADVISRVSGEEQTGSQPSIEDEDSLDDDHDENAGISLESMYDKDWVTGMHKCRQCSFAHLYLAMVRSHFMSEHVMRRLYQCYYCSSFESAQSSKVKEHCRLQHASRELRLIKRPPLLLATTPDAEANPVISGASDLDIEIVGVGDSARVNRCLSYYIERRATGEWACRLCKNESLEALGMSSLHIRRHILAYHLKILMYSCKYCNAACDRLGDVKAHLANFHASLPLRIVKKQLDFADIEDKLASLYISAKNSNAKVKAVEFTTDFRGRKSLSSPNQSACSVNSSVDQSSSSSTHATKNKDPLASSSRSIQQLEARAESKSIKNARAKDESLPTSSYYCGHCSKTDLDINTMKFHILTEHFNIRAYQCWYCSFSSQLETAMKAHLKKFHRKPNNTPRKSADWDMITIDANRVMTFEGNNAPAAVKNKATDCASEKSAEQANCKTVAQAESHEQQSPASNSNKGQTASTFACQHCKQIYNSMKLLKNHVFSHFRDQVYVCSECDTPCSGKCVLKSHFYTAHPGQSIKVHDITDKLTFTYSGSTVYAAVRDEHIHPSFVLGTSVPPESQVAQVADSSHCSAVSAAADTPPTLSAGKATARSKKRTAVEQQLVISAKPPIRTRRLPSSSSVSSLSSAQSSTCVTPSHSAPQLQSPEPRSSTPMSCLSISSGPAQPVVSSTTECKSFCCRHCGLLANSLLTIVEHLVCHFKDGSFCCLHCDFPDERCTALRDHYKLSHGVELYTGWLMGISDMVEKRMVGSRTMVSVRDESSAAAGASFTYDSPADPPPFTFCSNSLPTLHSANPPLLSPQLSQVQKSVIGQEHKSGNEEKQEEAKTADADGEVASGDNEKVLLWVCKHCEWTTKFKHAVQSHMRCHYKDPMINCFDCGTKFMDMSALSHHYTEVHPGLIFRYKLTSLVDKCIFTQSGNQCVVSMKADCLGKEQEVTRRQGLAERKRSSAANDSKSGQSHRKKSRTTLDEGEKSLDSADVDLKPEISTVPVDGGSDSVQVAKGGKATKAGTAGDAKGFVHECVLCRGKFSNFARAQRHVRMVHIDRRAFKCELCGSEFEYKLALESHHALAHAGLSLTVTNVAAELRDECVSYLVKKSVDEVATETYSCFACSFTTQRIQNMRVHLCKELGYRPFECGHCGQKFRSKVSYHKHAQNIHSGNLALVLSTDVKMEQQIELHLQERNGGRLRLQKLLGVPNSSPSSSPSKQGGKGKKAVADRVKSRLFKVQQRAALRIKFMQQKKCKPASSVGSPSRKRTSVENGPEKEVDSEASSEKKPKCAKFSTDTRIACVRCPKQLFSSRLGLDIHAFYMHQDRASKPHVVSCAIHCPFCQLLCTSEEALVSHVISNHRLPLDNARDDDGETKKSCSLCHASFESTAERNSHLKVHLPAYTFQCAHCGYAATKKWGIMKHSEENHPHKAMVAVHTHNCVKRQYAVPDSGGVVTSNVSLQPLVHLHSVADADSEALL